MSLKWWSLTGEEWVPFHIQIWGGRNERAERLLGFSWQPPVPLMLVGEDLKKGRWKEEDGVAGHCDRESIVWCASRASLWHWSPVGAGRVSGLLFWLVWDFLFFPTFLLFFWARCHLAVDHRQGLVRQPAVSVTNCHWHCLSFLTGWTDDGHLNGRHHSAPPHIFPKPSIQRNHRYSSPRPLSASLSVFWVIHM